MSPPDFDSVKTPEWCTADFCILPIGTGQASVSSEVANVQRLLGASGLTFTLHSAGTTVEGQWDSVMRVIGQAHQLLHDNGCVRVQTDIRAGTRTDKRSTAADKVNKVQALLRAADA